MAPPANDAFASPTALSTTLPGTLTGLTTFDATAEGGEADLGAGSSQQSIWFTFVAPSTATYRFRIPRKSIAYHGTHTADWGDINMYLGSPAANSLANFVSANILASDFGSSDPAWVDPHDVVVEAAMTSGQTYRLRIDSSFFTQNKASVDFDLQWDLAANIKPSNDNFADAIPIPAVLPYSAYGETTKNSTYETGEPKPDGGNTHQSVWYTFTPTSTGRYRFWLDIKSTVVWTDFRRSTIVLYSGSSLGALTSLARQTNPSASSSFSLRNGAINSIEVNLTAGTTYRIQVGSPYFTGEGANAHSFNFDINVEAVTAASAPANDNLSGATNLGTNPADGNYSGTMRGATDDAGAFNYGSETVWIKFVAGASGAKEMHIVNPNYTVGSSFADDYFTPTFDLYRVTGTNPPTAFSDLTYIDSSDLDGFPDFREWIQSVSPTLVAGATYYIVLYDLNYLSNNQGDYQFVLGTYTPASAPPNDDKVDAEGDEFNLSLSQYGAYLSYPRARAIDGTTTLASAEAGDPTVAGFAATRNVWYRMRVYTTASYKVWVESAVDCVLGIFQHSGFGTVGTLVAQDDDSGTGDQPEITTTLTSGQEYWVVVDSKTEGDFTLKFQEVVAGTPANDDFADAQVISSVPFSAAGSTVGAGAEPYEKDAEELGVGPTDSVWYKYVAGGNGILKIKATCDTNNNDAYVYIDTWHGTTLAGLTRSPEPPPTGPGGGINRGFFNHFDTPAELEAAAINLNVVSGETYYIRVQTESGGSEDFTIYVEVAAVYLDLTASGSEEFHGTLIDSAEVYLDLQVSSAEVFHTALTTDSATVALDLQASGVDIKAFQYVDAGTAQLVMTPSVLTECYFHLEPSWTADGVRKWQYDSQRKWSADGTRRWTWIEGEGLPQIC